MPMTQDRDATGRAYAQLATGIVSELGQGHDVVFLCEGDPAALRLLRPPAAAARQPVRVRGHPGHHLDHRRRRRWPACRSAMCDEPLALIPATMPRRAPGRHPAPACDRVVVIKVGRHLGKVQGGAGAPRGMLEDAVLVENVDPAAASASGRSPRSTETQAPYFSLIIAGRKRARRMTLAPAIVILGAAQRRPGRTPAPTSCPAREIHAPACADCAADVPLRQGRPLTSPACSRDGRPIVGICAAGILIRALAPLLGDKRAEPPVVAVAEDGSAVVPLLGGHHGANELARGSRRRSGVAPAVTTAGDLRFGVALDAPPPGWTLANPERRQGGHGAAARRRARCA